MKEINGSTSDGYHTFDELYEHRHALFLNLMKVYDSWISTKHNDGTSFDDWFIAGITLDSGRDITYHLPARLWGYACKTGAKVLERAPVWDGHTSQDVVKRLYEEI